ncbi:glycosyltransferase family 1 protein [Nocardioides marmoriginsengisoli]|uniref:Glycosyltransferase family 1 protein n=1 Tax=Nocardioides marmoriginsengisoli TaxID=661483 RepID=A0A3N0CP27_9ACTN|nr:glycosyltransferase family 1 protein [Nocardioides marmoriginsengisoli]RNL65110.1 glycosyltransferase family 1 protein [Nocardioides marmoriginsengisoli]
MSALGSTLARRSITPAHPVSGLRILVVTESFLPQVNGVTNSVRRVLEHLEPTPHQVLVLAPSGPDEYAGARVHRVASVAMPSYRDFPIGLASAHTLRRIFAEFQPDVVHLASPALLGRAAGAMARSLGIPVVAVYQTDLIGFAARYRFPGGTAMMRRLTTSIHGAADLNLVPSSASAEQLAALGVGRTVLWPRGVDTAQFHPGRRTDQLREEVGAEPGEVLLGYVGRLAAEKELDLLHAIQHLPGHRLVVVGGGPEEGRLRALLPDAHFLGVRHGEDLGRIVASLDVFVHTGSTETFCQAAQEALASGVPVVAPDAGGPRDLVRSGENGLLFTPGDGSDLYAHLDALVSSPGLRARMGAAAYAGTRGRTWAGVNNALLDHYLRLVRQPGVLPLAG